MMTSYPLLRSQQPLALKEIIIDLTIEIANVRLLKFTSEGSKVT
jgi:hypothetical protein